MNIRGTKPRIEQNQEGKEHKEEGVKDKKSTRTGKIRRKSTSIICQQQQVHKAERMRWIRTIKGTKKRKPRIEKDDKGHKDQERRKQDHQEQNNDNCKKNKRCMERKTHKQKQLQEER